MTSAAMQSGKLVFSSGRAWIPLLAAVLGVMTAFSAHSGRDALVVVVTAVAGGGLATWALLIGALRLRVPGQGINWMLEGAGLAGMYLASAALSGWSLSVWPGVFVSGSQIFNGSMVGCALYAFGRYLRRRRSPLQS